MTEKNKWPRGGPQDHPRQNAIGEDKGGHGAEKWFWALGCNPFGATAREQCPGAGQWGEDDHSWEGLQSCGPSASLPKASRTPDTEPCPVGAHYTKGGVGGGL